MKIGILTFHKAANYGAVLQAYALQRFMVERGAKAEIIDYMEKKIAASHAAFSLRDAKTVEDFLKMMIRFPIRFHKRIVFDKFIKKELLLSKKRNIKKNEMKEYCGEYFKIIVGSDQVWNRKLTGNDGIFFLDFLENHKKYSYAASFGKIEENEVLEIINLLKKFERITIREKSSISTLKKNSDLEYDLVLDPTALLSKNEWADFSKKIRKDHILAYGLSKQMEIEELAMEESKKMQKEVISINDTLFRKRKITYLAHPTPQEWVGLIQGASLVATNSFHGVMFSLILNKNVLIHLSSFPERIFDLLECLEIEYVVRNNCIKITPDDWTKINKKIEEEKQKSGRILCEICGI